MKVNIRHDRFIVISDLHLGNPFSNINDDLVDFLHLYCDKGYNICINGDGIDIAHTSFLKVSKVVPEVLRELHRFKEKGQLVYYVVGNHDIALEHFMGQWSVVEVVPFLNLLSGDKRIRIDHGHLYDPRFVNRPLLYESLVIIAKPFLFLAPSLYRLWMFYEGIRYSDFFYKGLNEPSIKGENKVFSQCAQYLMKRGFDTVVFGHTHREGVVEFGQKKTYINTGSWMLESSYVKIDNGKCVLEQWRS